MNIGHHFTTTLTLARASGVSNFGDPTYAAQTTINARVEHGSRTVISSEGTEIQSEAMVASHSPLYETDRIWLPGEDTDNTKAARRPIMVKKATPLSGSTTLYEAYL